MFDITKCGTSSKCPLKEKCYRHTAKDNGRYQSWAMFMYNEKEKICGDFWDNKEKTKTL